MCIDRPCKDMDNFRLNRDYQELKQHLNQRQGDEIDIECYWCLREELQRRGALKETA